MAHQPSLLHKSLSLLHSFLTIIFASFLLEPSVFAAVWGGLPWVGKFLMVGQGMAFILRVYFFSGIYGTLAEMAAGETMVLSYPRFRADVKRFWKFYLLISSAPLLVHFLFFLSIPADRLQISLRAITLFLDVPLSLVIVYWIFQKKYLQPYHLPRRANPFLIKRLPVVTAFFLGNLALLVLPHLLPKEPWDGEMVVLLVSKYWHFLTILYLAHVFLQAYPEIAGRFSDGKELVLINPLGPGIVEGTGSIFIRSYPPVFVVLKALTPKIYRVREFNRVLWRDRYYQSGKLVAITCFTSNCAEAYKMAREFKKRGSTVIMGGPHVTYLPDEALEYCDSVVVGEAEGVWKDIVRDYENNALQKKYVGAAEENFHEEVHRELLQSPPEIIKDYLETTRGCKFRCHFCTIPGLSGGRTRKKPVFEVVELLEKIKHKYKHALFLDNNIYSDPAYAKELFQALKPLKMHWSTQCTIDIARNDETLRLAKESGCRGFLFGYEISGDSVEKRQGGKFAMAGKYLQFSRKIKKMGIDIKAHYIFGYDTDGYKDLLRLWKFCFAVQPLFTVISILTPLPGSALYDDMVKHNRLTNLNWRNYACHSLVFQHPSMNTVVVSLLYPFLYAFFLFTTSRGGQVMLAIAALAIAL